MFKKKKIRYREGTPNLRPWGGPKQEQTKDAAKEQPVQSTSAPVNPPVESRPEAAASQKQSCVTNEKCKKKLCIKEPTCTKVPIKVFTSRRDTKPCSGYPPYPFVKMIYVNEPIDVCPENCQQKNQYCGPNCVQISACDAPNLDGNPPQSVSSSTKTSSSSLAPQAQCPPETSCQCPKPASPPCSKRVVVDTCPAPVKAKGNSPQCYSPCPEQNQCVADMEKEMKKQQKAVKCPPETSCQCPKPASPPCSKRVVVGQEITCAPQVKAKDNSPQCYTPCPEQKGCVADTEKEMKKRRKAAKNAQKEREKMVKAYKRKIEACRKGGRKNVCKAGKPTCIELNPDRVAVEGSRFLGTCGHNVRDHRACLRQANCKKCKPCKEKWSKCKTYEYGFQLALGVILLVGCTGSMAAWVWIYSGGIRFSVIDHEDDLDEYHNTHYLMGIIGFVTCEGLAMMLFRACRECPKLILAWFHTVFHVVTISAAILSLISTWNWHTAQDPKVLHFYSVHSWAGCTTVILYILQFSIGFFSYVVIGCASSADIYRVRLAPIHASFGLITFLMGVVTCCTGLHTLAIEYDGNYEKQFTSQGCLLNCIGVLIVLSALVVTNILSRAYRRGDQP